MNKPLILSVCLSVLLSACVGVEDGNWIEEKYTDSSSRFIELDGNRVHYRDEGEGEVLVLIHGTASSLHTWDAWVSELKRDYRVIRMDLPGFGLTGPDYKNRYEVSDDTAFLAAFLGALNVESAHFVGSSLGGRIAWQFALEKPKKVRTLTLMNSLGYRQEKWPPPIEMAQWPVIDMLMTHVSPRFMFGAGLKDVYFDETLVTEALVDRYYELSRYPGNVAAFPMRVKARLDKDENLIPQIDVPTLIMWGEEDKYFPVSSAYRFKEDIAQSELQIYPSVGHLPMEELADQSRSHLLEFLRRY